MPRYDLPDHARRLDTILRDLGYVTSRGGDRVDRARACKVINRRVLRPLAQNRFDSLCQGTTMTAEEAVQIADGLGFNVLRLLYDDPPRRPERPQNLLDELDALGYVE